MQMQKRRAVLYGMAWLGLGAAGVTVALRSLLLPTLRDTQTGAFASGWLPVAVLLAVLAVLAILGFSQRADRVEMGGKGTLPAAFTSLTCGGLLLLCTLWDGWLWLTAGEMPAPQTAQEGGLAQTVLALQLVCGLLGGVALVRLGLVLAAEGGSRRGIASWSMLAPVLWMWFRLARYEMSYSSTLRFSQSFFDFVMFILELLFLFKLARYTAGVGKVGAGSLQFFAAATAAFSLSAPVTRLVMYLLGDGEAFRASPLAGLPDAAIGLLALGVAFSLAAGRPEEAPQDEPLSEEEESVEEGPSSEAELLPDLDWDSEE